MEVRFKQQQGHRPLLRQGSSSLSWLEWFYSRVVCTFATTVVQFSCQHLVAAGEETKQHPAPSPHQKINSPTVFTNSHTKAAWLPYSPTKSLHFWSQAKGFVCTGGPYKLLKWMFKFGGLNHSFLETDRTPQFLNIINLLQQEEGNFDKVAALSIHCFCL